MRIAFIVFVLAVGLLHAVQAQQTIFNVPSQDVLAPGTVYGEVDVPFRVSDPKFVTVTPRVVIGYGYNLEGGLNLPGYVNVGDRLWAAHLTLKHGQALDTVAPWTLTEGAHLLIPLTSGRDAGVFGYAMSGYKFFGRLRIAAGAYGATNAFAGTGNTLGALGSIELALNDWLTFAIDGYSGQNALGFVTPGFFVVPAANWILYPAYQFSNISREADSFLVEIGYTF